MPAGEHTTVGILVTALLGLAGFTAWLIKGLLKAYEKNAGAMQRQADSNQALAQAIDRQNDMLRRELDAFQRGLTGRDR